MKEVWFQYIIDNKKHWCNGVTLKRLEKVKSAVLDDEDIMFDLLHRHGADKQTPEQMMKSYRKVFDHCIGNFSTAIMFKMMDVGLIKTIHSK